MADVTPQLVSRFRAKKIRYRRLQAEAQRCCRARKSDRKRLLNSLVEEKVVVDINDRKDRHKAARQKRYVAKKKVLPPKIMIHEDAPN